MKNVYTIGECKITVKQLAAAIYEHGQFLKKNFAKGQLTHAGNDFDGGEVRLRVYGSHWSLHTGDSQYDQDHRGFWAFNSVSRGVSGTNGRNVARELLEEVLEDAAQNTVPLL